MTALCGSRGSWLLREEEIGWLVGGGAVVANWFRALVDGDGRSGGIGVCGGGDGGGSGNSVYNLRLNDITTN